MVARSSVVTTGRFGAVTVVMGLGMQGCVFVQRPCRCHSWALSADGIAAAHHWAGAASCGWSSGLSLVVVLLEADVGLCVRLWFLTCESRAVTQLFSVSGIRQGLQKSRTAEICREGYQRFRASLACFYKCCLNMGRKESYWCLLSK